MTEAISAATAPRFAPRGHPPVTHRPSRILARDYLVKSAGWLAALLVMGLSIAPAHAAHVLGKLELEHANRQLHGTLVDYTHNHGADRRLWSWALCQRRDLYV